MKRLGENLYDFLIRPWSVQLKIVTGPLWQNSRIRRDYRSFLKKFDLILSSKIVQKDLSEVVREESDCTLVNPTRWDGNLSLDALYCIGRLVRYVNPRRIFEIGTFNGNTALQMAANSRDDCQVFTLDLPSEGSGTAEAKYPLLEDDKKYVGMKKVIFEGSPYERKITRLLGDSAQFDFRLHYGQMDFVFVDGSHAFDYVKNDTEQALRMLAPNGMIVWDDYDASWPDVIRYLNRLAREKEIVWISGTSLCLYRSS